MFQPLKKRNVVHDVIWRIIGMMQGGVLKPGERLPSERQLAEALGVSRSSVRAATQILAFNKFLDIRPGSGIYFSQMPELMPLITGTPPPKDEGAFAMHNESRMIVEPMVARLAALYASAEQLEALEAVVARMTEYVESESLGGYAVEDMGFHRLCAEATGNPYLSRMADEYCLDLTYLMAFGTTPGLEVESLDQHRALLEAFRARDPDKAELLMRRHINYAFEKNAGYLYDAPSAHRAGISYEE